MSMGSLSSSGTSASSIIHGFPDKDLRQEGQDNPGYFPARLGQSLEAGRFCIVRKLGCQYSSFWLAKDKKTNQFVALKILTPLQTSDEKKRSDELRMLQNIATAQRSHRMHEDVIMNETYQRVVNELNEVMDNDEHAESRVENGREVDESISDNLDDAMEINAEVAEEETRRSEVPEYSVTHQQLLNYRNGLRKEIEHYGMPKCYKDGQFFVYPPHPVFALHKATIQSESLSPDPLCLRPIFVWLPEHLPGRPDHFKCRCGINLTMNGYNDNPIARRVRTCTGTDYFLFTNRYICDSRRVNGRGCGTSYQGSDPHLLDQLPRWVQEAFPAYLTTCGAVDKLVVDQMKPCFSGRFGPEPFSKMLHELQMLQHSRRELMYLSAAAAYGLSGTQVPQFPAFDDPMKYSGSSPSVRYLKCIWTDYHAGVKIYHDRIQASLSGFKLAGDHTFRIMKALARLKSEPIFAALFSLVNEWEEIRKQAMGLTKGLSILPEMFEDVKTGLEEHGHQPTNIYYSDNPYAERDFHERVMNSLKENVIHIARNSALDAEQCPPFPLPSPSLVEFYSTFMHINTACESILELLEVLDATQSLVIALSTSYNVHKSLHSIQLRLSKKIFVFEILNITPGKVPPCLRSVLNSPRIIKVGHGIVQSIIRIANALNIPDLLSIATQNQTGPFLDIGQLSQLKGAVQSAYTPLSSLVSTVLKQRLVELPDISFPVGTGLHHWSQASALHVDSIWQIYLSLKQYNSVGLRLEPSQVRIGQLVTLVASRKEVAEAVITDHNGYLDVVMDDNNTTTRLKITPAYSLILITKVLVPGSIVNKHNQTVQWILSMGERLLFKHVHYGLDLQYHLDSQSILSIGPSEHLLSHVLSVPPEENEEADTSSEGDGLNESQFNENEGDEDEDHDFSDNEDDYLRADYGEDNPAPTSEELVVNSIHDAQNFLTQLPELDNPTFASRVLDDAFHFMDRLLRTLPKKHSAFKEFSHQFSETIFVRDGDDLRAVKAVLEKKEISWDYVVRAKKSWLNRHIRRYIPPPAKLEADLKLLFDSFQNIVCSSDRKNGRGRFFSKESIQISTHLLESVHCGFLSDPPSIPLYYIIGWDRDKLPIYRTIRGTNSIEGGVHMLIRRIFGSLKASPELAVALLSNWTLRRNQRVGHFNRTGKKWTNHFDIWLLDEITEHAIYLNILPSFRIPRMLATRIATSESFGIIPIPAALAKEYHITSLPARRLEGLPHHRDTPVHLLTRLSTRITNPYRYLQLIQRTVFPVIPVHTRKEFAEFKHLVVSDNIRSNSTNVPVSQAWKGVNYIKFAKIWNILVDAQDATHTDPNERLYYKLPEQLLRHHKKVLDWQASRATMLDGSNAALVQDHSALLHDPKRLAVVLPAVTLDDSKIRPDPTVDGIRGLDLQSFNPMALIQQDSAGNTYSDSQFIIAKTVARAEDDSSDPVSVVASTEPNLPRVGTQTTAGTAVNHQRGMATAQTQLTFAGVNTSKQPPSKKRRLDDRENGRSSRECAVCTYYHCIRASECSGRGGRKLCYTGVCKHEDIGGSRVRRR
ncbi:hypothetical protein D9757_012171 [Collybiopsis confluens]|uniref:DUF6729 domain-containing protein n=1 Tax=Collybiopsis confluens TaxID=2823264 RepID=A0A8H5GKQ4_9AGAR|nr:hypothetical protein D9757_012171 [Collybiopsis confluens]